MFSNFNENELNEEDENEEEDEENELEEEEEKERVKHIKDVVDNLKLKRTNSTQRQSTIVQVNTGALEIHLRQMKKQLQRHEEELKHPSWMDDLMKEVNKIAELIRKIEHCQLDINNLRDIFATYTSPSDTRTPLKNLEFKDFMEKIKLVTTDIEGLRLVVRRIDLQNALSSTALVKIADLQKAVKGILKDQKGGANAAQLLRLQDTFETQMKTLKSKIEEVDNQSVSESRALRNKFIETESHLMAKLESLDKSHTQRLTSLEDKAMNEVTTAVTHMKDKLENTTNMARRAILLAIKKPIIEGSELLRTAVQKRKFDFLKTYFRRWQEYDPYGVLRRGRNALRLFTRSGERFVLRKAFFDWKRYFKLQINREKHREHMKNLIRIWDQRVKPNLSVYFRRWKRNIVFMKFHGSFQYSRSNSAAFSRSSSFASPPMSPSRQLTHNFLASRTNSAVFDTARSNSNQKIDDDPDSSFLENDKNDNSFIDDSMSQELIIQPTHLNQQHHTLFQQHHQQQHHSLLHHTLPLSLPVDGDHDPNQSIVFQPPIAEEDGLYGKLMGTLNILKDPTGCVDLIGLYIDNILNKIRMMDENLAGTQIVMTNNSEIIERNRLQLLHTMNTKFQSIESVHNYHKAGVTAQFQRFRQDFNEREEASKERDRGYQSQFQQISDQLNKIDKRLSDQDERITRLYNLHGKMLERLDKIDHLQGEHIKELKDLRVVVTRVDKLATTHEANFVERTRRLDDSMVHLNSEIKANKSVQKQIFQKLEEVIRTQINGTSDVKGIAHDIHQRMDKLESWMNTTSPLPPTPLEIATLCVEYEDKTIESQKKGHGIVISPDLAYDMGRIAHILAHHVVEITDIDVLSHVMKGLHLFFPDANQHIEKHEPLWNNETTNTTNNHSNNGGNNDNDGSPLTHEEYCLSLREKFLSSFFDQFQIDIDKLRPELGAVRKEARLTFLRRFIESLELALSKLDAIVIGTSSSLGRSNTGGITSSSASCIACDRPLRMRITSTPLHKLQSKIIQNQELSPKTKRKRLQNQVQSTITIPSFHSNVYTTTRVGKKKGEYINGIDTTKKNINGNDGNDTKVLGMDYFTETIHEDNSINQLNNEENHNHNHKSENNENNENVDGETNQNQKLELNIQIENNEQLEHEETQLIQSQSTSALANELRNLVKLSSTGVMGYSKSQSKIQTKRPKSAGAGTINMNPSGTNKPMKSTQITYQGNNHNGNNNGNNYNNALIPSSSTSDITPKYVKKGGFKMRVTRTMPQEKLVETISTNYLRDISFPSPVNNNQGGITTTTTTTSGGSGIFLPSPDIKKIKPIDLIPPNESSSELLNLSSYYKENN